MSLSIVLAMAGGFLLGGGFVFWLFRRGLDEHGWYYFREFLDALRRGEYTEHDDEEGSEDDGE